MTAPVGPEDEVMRGLAAEVSQVTGFDVELTRRAHWNNWWVVSYEIHIAGVSRDFEHPDGLYFLRGFLAAAKLILPSVVSDEI